jgi:hypothetical protein
LRLAVGYISISRAAYAFSLQARGLQAVNYHTADAFHEFVAQLRVFLALLAKPGCIENERARRLVCPRAEVPRIRLEQP